MSTAVVTHDPTIGTYDVVFKAKDFENIKSAVAFIKTFVPAAMRSYNPLNKTWTIDESQWQICKTAFESNFVVRVSEKPKPKYTHEDFFYNHAPTSSAPTKESVAQKLEVMLSINIATTPFDDLKRAYRRKALELHPDRNNGDGSRMSELNAAWTIYNQ